MKIESLFLLLRLGLETERATEDEMLVVATLTKEEWGQIGEIAGKQGVLAFVLDGIEKCRTESTDYRDNLPSELKLEWIGQVIMIEQANQQQKAVMNDLVEKWTNEGCRVMVFKGHANGIFYPKPKHRSPGDIDCYLFDNYAKGNDIARTVGAEVDEGWYKHSQIHYRGEMFENHQFFVHTRNGRRGKRLETELEEALPVKDSCFRVHGCVMYPPPQWTAMFLTCHACAHFMSEGLRLKQILDWAMFLNAHQDDVEWKAFYGFCERNHLRRFSDAMTHIATKHFGIKISNPVIVKESPYAEKILENTLYGEDYVFSSGNKGWKNRWHIVTNLFKYSWKYEDVYQMSIYKQLWYYVTGYLFKTE